MSEVEMSENRGESTELVFTMPRISSPNCGDQMEIEPPTDSQPVPMPTWNPRAT